MSLKHDALSALALGAMFFAVALLPDPPFPGGARFALASTKLSQVVNGNLVSAATDQVVTVRNGTTDVLASVGSLAGENLTSVITDNGSGGATLGARQVTNTMLQNPAMTLAGHSVSLGGTQTFVCADLGNAAASCSTDATNLANDSGTLPNGVLATTQSANDNSTKVATDAYVDRPNLKQRQFGISFDGNGSAITAGTIRYRATVPCAGTITNASLAGSPTGSIVIDVWKIAAGTSLPTVANTIDASDLPTILSAVNNGSGGDSTLTGWTTAVTAGDIMGFKVNIASTMTSANLVLTMTCN